MKDKCDHPITNRRYGTHGQYDQCCKCGEYLPKKNFIEEMKDIKDKPDFEKLIEDEAQERYPVNDTTGDLYTGAKITFKHGGRFIWSTYVEPLQVEMDMRNEYYENKLEGMQKTLDEYYSDNQNRMKELERLQRNYNLQQGVLDSYRKLLEEEKNKN